MVVKRRRAKFGAGVYGRQPAGPAKAGAHGRQTSERLTPKNQALAKNSGDLARLRRCFSSEVRCLPSETIAPPPRPGAQDAGPESLDPGRRPVAGSQPGLLPLLRGPVPWQPARTLAPPPRPGALADALPPLTCRQSEAAALPKMLFFGFLHAESRRTRDTFSASKTSLSFRTFEDSTFEQAEGSLLWKSTSF